MEIRFWGACGVEECVDCLPLFDADNSPIEGTESPVVASRYARGAK